MDEFVIYPAIDLRHGQVVRLQMGDPDLQTIYSSDPGRVARNWIEAGACWLHVINLDGAFGEAGTANRGALDQIMAEAQPAGVQVQVGGGIRSLDAIDVLFAKGVGRVVLGTALIKDPELLPQALKRWGSGRIVAALDACQRQVQVDGWRISSGQNLNTLACRFKEWGLERMIYTDIARDGMEQGLNLGMASDLSRLSRLKVIASGGFSQLAEVEAARQAGLAGVVVGKAVYDGLIRPEDLPFAFRSEASPC